MGFAAITGRAKNPELLVAVALEKPDVEGASAAASAGASFLLLTGANLQKDAAKIQAVTSAVDIPCGISLDAPTIESAEHARTAGLDFIVLANDASPAALLLDEETGFVITVGDDLSDTALRLRESLPIDAIFGATAPHPLSIEQQLDLRRISGLTRKALILRSNDESSSEELECLRDSGVAALLIEGANATNRLIAVKGNVDTIRPRRRRRTERDATPVLPSVGRGGEDSDEED
jgi:hypothetical protein